MTSTVKTVKRSIVSLDLPRRVPALITMTRGIVTALTNNATTFPAPDPRAGRPQAYSRGSARGSNGGKSSVAPKTLQQRIGNHLDQPNVVLGVCTIEPLESAIQIAAFG